MIDDRFESVDTKARKHLKRRKKDKAAKHAARRADSADGSGSGIEDRVRSLLANLIDEPAHRRQFDRPAPRREWDDDHRSDDRRHRRWDDERDGHRGSSQRRWLDLT